MPVEQSVKIAVRGLTRATGALLFGMPCALPASASADVDALEQCVAEFTHQREEAPCTRRYAFAWPVAIKTRTPALSVSDLAETPQIAWLDSGVLSHQHHSHSGNQEVT
jgi:hypothetical protein